MKHNEEYLRQGACVALPPQRQARWEEREGMPIQLARVKQMGRGVVELRAFVKDAYSVISSVEKMPEVGLVYLVEAVAQSAALDGLGAQNGRRIDDEELAAIVVDFGLLGFTEAAVADGGNIRRLVRAVAKDEEDEDE